MSAFKVGDRVKVKLTAGFSTGSIGTIIEVGDSSNINWDYIIQRDSARREDRCGYMESELELYEDSPLTLKQAYYSEIAAMARELYIGWAVRGEGLADQESGELDKVFDKLPEMSFKVAEIWITYAKEYEKQK